MLRLELWGLRKQRERHKQRSKGVLQDARSNCNIHNTGNILNSIIPVLYQSIVTCMHEFNYAIVHVHYDTQGINKWYACMSTMIRYHNV